MQQVSRRTPLQKCDFNKVVPTNTYEGQLLEIKYVWNQMKYYFTIPFFVI